MTKMELKGYLSAVQDLRNDRHDVMSAERKAKLRRCCSELEKLERFIATCDPLMRTILTARYIDGKTWSGVAAAVGGGITSDNCRIMVDRLFQKK